MTGLCFTPPPFPRLTCLVIDTITPLLATAMGGPGGGGGGPPRQHVGHALMAEAGRTLARLARGTGAGVVVTNSVTADRLPGWSGGGGAGGGDQPADGPPGGGAPRGLKPSLGPSWRYVPDVTLLLAPTAPPTTAPRGGEAPPRAQPHGEPWPHVRVQHVGV